tara:strand:+ start:2166 stop:4118 length:1953 start_codon:yes stop_codon:yes gene_type:complete
MAYNSNIQPGNPPLVWDSFRKALDEVNANFVTIGATLAGGEQKSIISATQASPVIVTTSAAHGLVDGQRVTITNAAGMTQLNGQTFFVDVASNIAFGLFSDAGISTPTDGTGFGAYTGSGLAQPLLEFSALNLEALTTSIKPGTDATYVFGDATHKWKQAHIAETLQVAGQEDNGLYLGTARIKGESGKVDLPFGSTIAGDLIIDPEKRYFRYINLDDGDIVEADHTNDTLSFYGGTGVQLVAGSDADSITFINAGVTQSIASTGISVSSATGNVTITNTGVTSAQNTTNIPSRATGRTPGEGVTVSTTTGAVQFTNTGVLEVQQGFGITVSTDGATGVATVSNSAPAVPTFQQIAVDGQTNIAADNTADILTFENGYGITITTDTINDKLIFTVNKEIDISGSVFGDDSALLVDGVLSKIVGPVDTQGPLYIDSVPIATSGNDIVLTSILPSGLSTTIGSVSSPFNTVYSNQFVGSITGDVTGSLFADDSTLMIDAVDNKVIASLTGDVTGNVVGNLTGNSTGYHTGDIKGSVFGDDSTKIIDSVENKIYGDVIGTHTGNIFTNLIDSADSSAITVTPMTVFSSDVSVQNELTAPVINAGNIVSTGFVQFSSLTTTQRNALAAVNGMVIYNSTDNKFQGYEDSAWVNLV